MKMQYRKMILVSMVTCLTVLIGCTNKDNQLDDAVVNDQTSKKTVEVVL